MDLCLSVCCSDFTIINIFSTVFAIKKIVPESKLVGKLNKRFFCNSCENELVIFIVTDIISDSVLPEHKIKCFS